MTIKGNVFKQDVFALADWSNVRRYDGTWKDTVEDGLGREAWFDGASYCGQFKNGLRDGYGIYLHRSSLGYEKNFRVDQDNPFFDKQPWLKCAPYSSVTFSLFLKNELKNDTQRWKAAALGWLYAGQFERGLRHGYGSIVLRNGDMFEGRFDNDRKHGLPSKMMLLQAKECIYKLWVKGNLFLRYNPASENSFTVDISTFSSGSNACSQINLEVRYQNEEFFHSNVTFFLNSNLKKLLMTAPSKRKLEDEFAMHVIQTVYDEEKVETTHSKLEYMTEVRRHVAKADACHFSAFRLVSSSFGFLRFPIQHGLDMNRDGIGFPKAKPLRCGDTSVSSRSFFTLPLQLASSEDSIHVAALSEAKGDISNGLILS
eukprot:747394-Hanusia_phi.AAC.10